MFGRKALRLITRHHRVTIRARQAEQAELTAQWGLSPGVAVQTPWSGSSGGR